MSASITLEPTTGGTDRRPGETIELLARWSVESPPKTIVAKLYWFTRGKGTPDVGMVAEKPLGGSGLSGESRFSFTLPAGPYSFSGQLITLGWAIEVIIDDEVNGEWAFVLAPNGNEILLGDPAGAQLPTGVNVTASLR